MLYRNYNSQGRLPAPSATWAIGWLTGTGREMTHPISDVMSTRNSGPGDLPCQN
ncbi:unnamed protein product [Penicillium roqueforti FM164]|uniref:Genomic scaffold, ProqFM164S02 n=1 Tax=Penicillium roqueforti (strain FM164) TaxID=1365484 RepID=W6Q8I4_PENRF|nr:unnamed protein product [Penicillium roqueforti FM164]